MAKRRPLTRDVYTFKIKHMTKHGSTPTTATDFYKAVEESGSDKLWLEKHGLDGIWNSIRGVWRAKPRQQGGGLRQLHGAEKPFPEILVLRKFGPDRSHRKILTTFARMRHLDEALTVKDDNLHMQIEAFAQEKELVAMAKAAAKGDPETWLSSITFETVGSGPGEDEEGEEGEGEEGEGEEDE